MQKSGHNILVTGTPGVGKTTLCRLLKDKLMSDIGLDYQYINLADLIHEKKLYKSWDKEFDVPIFDEDMVCDELENLMVEKGVILEFHTSGFFPERWFDLVVLLRTDNTVLFDRLQERGYNEKKITENIECEILDVTADEVKESYKENIIMELKSDNADNMEANLDAIIKRISELA